MDKEQSIYKTKRRRRETRTNWKTRGISCRTQKGKENWYRKICQHLMYLQNKYESQEEEILREQSHD